MQLLVFVLFVVAFAYLLHRISNLEDVVRRMGQVAKPSVSSVPLPPLVPQAARQVAAPQTTATIPQVATAASVSGGSFDEVSGGRWLGRVGIVALFIGIAFFLKYAFDAGIIGIQARILLGLAIGVSFIGAGQYFRTRYAQYSDVIIGGGGGILYVTLFAASSLYHLVSLPAAFVGMIFVTALIAGLSILDGSLVLAFLSVLGGFATPYLLGASTTPPEVLFTYIGVLDVVVLALAAYRKWPTLIYLAFIGTALQYMSWFATSYSPDLLGAAFSALTFFFLAFVTVAFSNRRMNPYKLRDIDLMLTGVNAAGYFLFGYLLLNDQYHALMWVFALAVGAFYVAISYLFYILDGKGTITADVHLGIGVMLVTIAIPLKLEHSWITLAWLLEALFLFAIAFDYKRPSLYIFASCAYVLALIQLFADYFSRNAYAVAPFINTYVLLFLVAILIAYLVAYFAKKNEENILGSNGAALAKFYFIVAQLLSVFILTTEINAYYDIQSRNSSGIDLVNQRSTVISIGWTIYAAALIIVGFSIRSSVVRITGLIFFFITALKIFFDIWSLGEIYRIVASIIFGTIALLSSFLYVRYAERIKMILTQN